MNKNSIIITRAAPLELKTGRLLEIKNLIIMATEDLGSLMTKPKDNIGIKPSIDHEKFSRNENIYKNLIN